LHRDLGEMHTLTPNDAAAQGGQGCQVSGHGAYRLARIPLCEGGTYGTIPAEVVTHRRRLLD
jgi:hypothetical protein